MIDLFITFFIHFQHSSIYNISLRTNYVRFYGISVRLTGERIKWYKYRVQKKISVKITINSVILHLRIGGNS